MPKRRLRMLVLVAALVSGGLRAAAQAPAAEPGVVLMRAAQAHARAHGAKYVPVFSPSVVMWKQAGGAIDFAAVRAAGFPVVVWTVDAPEQMEALFNAGMDGIISDRPDLLRALALKHRSERGGLLDDAGLLKREAFDAQGHRGARDLRPENTLPAFEAALDNLVTTLETDVGITADGVALISHEYFVNPATCRDRSGAAYGDAQMVRIKDATFAAIRGRFVCDKIIRGATQTNDPKLSPVAGEFARREKLPSRYVHPTVPELFRFVAFYAEYYASGAGAQHAQAHLRAENARRVRFNLETKIDPRPEARERTFGPERFVEVLAGAITAAKLEARCDIQSFDFRTLALAQENFPAIRTVYLVQTMRALEPETWPEQIKNAK